MNESNPMWQFVIWLSCRFSGAPAVFGCSSRHHIEQQSGERHGNAPCAQSDKHSMFLGHQDKDLSTISIWIVILIPWNLFRKLKRQLWTWGVFNPFRQTSILDPILVWPCKTRARNSDLFFLCSPVQVFYVGLEDDQDPACRCTMKLYETTWILLKSRFDGPLD